MPNDCKHDQFRLTVWQLVTHWCPPGMKLNPVRQEARREIGITALGSFFFTAFSVAGISNFMVESGSTHTPDEALSVALMLGATVAIPACYAHARSIARHGSSFRFLPIENARISEPAPKQLPVFDTSAAVDISKDSDGLGRAAQRLLEAHSIWTERGTTALGIVRQGRVLQALELAFEDCCQLKTSPVLQASVEARAKLAEHLHEIADNVEETVEALAKQELDSFDANLKASRRLVCGAPGVV